MIRLRVYPLSRKASARRLRSRANWLALLVFLTSLVTSPMKMPLKMEGGWAEWYGSGARLSHGFL